MAAREVHTSLITDLVRKLCIEATTVLGDDVTEALRQARASEPSALGREVLDQLLDNAALARSRGISLCQDAGLAVVFIELGQEVLLVGPILQAAIDEGVRQGYAQGFLRPSTLDPVTRVNLGDNTPAIVHLEIVPGDRVGVHVLPKGFGGENMSRVVLFDPAVGLEGAKDFVVQRVLAAGAKACPPLVVGVGLGGNLEYSAYLAKRSLLRPLGRPHPDPVVASIEAELMERINASGIGPQGLGGRTTALAVHVETHPTHIGSLPVAVNLQCHSHRYGRAVL